MQADESDVMQAGGKRIISVKLEKYLYSPAFRIWPILNLLDLGFIMQIRMVMVYGDRNNAVIVMKDKKVYTLECDIDDHMNTRNIPYLKQLELPLEANVKTVACRSNYVYILFENGEVYFWKQSERRLDGLFPSKRHYTPAQRVNGFGNKYIADIACGGSHCLALTEDGQVYTWGKNDYGQIGNREKLCVHQPTQVELKGEKIVHIACGLNFNMVVTDTGKVYGWGDNEYGQIPNIYNDNNLVQSVYVFLQEVIATVSAPKIKKVSCGFYHTLALTDEGKIYAWGRNDNGQIGINSDLPRCSDPMMVNMPESESVKDIAAYGYLSVALSNNGIVYVWGECFGQNIKIPLPVKLSGIQDAFVFSKLKVMSKPLIVSDSDVKGILNILKSLKDDVPRVEFGDPEEVVQEERSKSSTNEIEERQAEEKRILFVNLEKYIYPPAFRNWPILNLLDLEFITQVRMVMVYYGGNNALIVTKNKKVYTLGYNTDYHVNTGNTFYPRQLEVLCHKNIKTVACSLYLVFVLSENGEVYFWNQIDTRLIRKPFLFKTNTPTLVDGLNGKCIVDIACGTHHFLALTKDGQVYTWGSNNHGEIGNRDTSLVDLPTQVELEGQKIVHIACGPFFSMAVTDTDKIYGWGDNASKQISALNQYCQDYYVLPTEIITGKKIKKVSCGIGHILALTDEGKIYAWGRNCSGQIGTNSDLSTCSDPMMVNMPESESVKDIAAYGYLSVALSNNGIVYVWGECFRQHIKVPLPTKLSGIQDAFAFSQFKFTCMSKPLIVSDSDVKEILHIFEFIDTFDLPGMKFNDSTTSDIIIKIGEDRIFVHEYILKTRSQYFKNKFDERDWIENNKRLVGLPVFNVPEKFSYIVYKSYIQYFYTGKVDLLFSKVSELAKLAKEYNEIGLQEALKKELIGCLHILQYKQYSLFET